MVNIMYGGTKSEMERLLADAQKFSGIKYDIDNLNDVYEAIHVVQTEMGITGTTAIEAEETISGSVGAMKAAYENLLVGLADSNANLELMIDNLMDSVLTVLDNLVPIIEQVINSVATILPSVIDKILEHLPQFLESGVILLETLIYGIMYALPQLMESTITIIKTITFKLLEMLPEILAVGIELLMSLIMGIVETIPELIPVIIDTVLTLVDTLLDNIDMLIDAGIELIIALALGLIEALPLLIERIPIIINKTLDAILRNRQKLVRAGIELIIQLALGLVKSIPNIIAAIPQIISAMVKAFKVFNWMSVGGDIVKGIASGVGKMAGVAVDAIKGVASSMLGGIKKFFGIKSPSRLMRDAIGKMIPQGIAVGVEADTDEAVDAIDDMNKQIMRANDPDLINMMDGRPTLSTQELMRSQSQDNTSSKIDRLVAVFDETLNKLSNPNYQMVLDTGVIVGEMKNEMDQALGNNQKMKGRGRE